jgi:hypothetical protein
MFVGRTFLSVQAGQECPAYKVQHVQHFPRKFHFF